LRVARRYPQWRSEFLARRESETLPLSADDEQALLRQVHTYRRLFHLALGRRRRGIAVSPDEWAVVTAAVLAEAELTSALIGSLYHLLFNRCRRWVERHRVGTRSTGLSITDAVGYLTLQIYRAIRGFRVGENRFTTYALTQYGGTLSRVSKSYHWHGNLESACVTGKDGEMVPAVELVPDPKSHDPSRGVESAETLAGVSALIDSLTESDAHRQILRMRLALGGGSRPTLAEVGSRFGLSRERIRQIEEKFRWKAQQWLQGRQEDLA
jgi:RNA polymerase sigma factor (sigma-70 family)